jgi:hypothetical protein
VIESENWAPIGTSRSNLIDGTTTSKVYPESPSATAPILDDKSNVISIYQYCVEQQQQ